jgi:hypothetical protein
MAPGTPWAFSIFTCLATVEQADWVGLLDAAISMCISP